ncbi:MAG: hypothetical protein AVDCRST_MAG19-3095 [uncultured Thermomicrobiales bacterium]|uniref:Uncharacterized protein n=1 Tax=uncultured Thermomicrobiales bacterium TaxID=1645740 RepID=A0A6J4VAL1_9BACT|nr:MAG: hypothetical protein AVDCRST_MAG19-3095 [uncultured Thermomicrobiales bacterium]
MVDLLPERLPWFVAGPALGLLVVGLYAVANRPIGSLGAYIQTLGMVRGGRVNEPWRVWFFGGVVAGGGLAALLRGDVAFGLGYGALGEALPLPLLVAVLLAGGALMGYGARWAGGGTTGHGLCGVSVLSPGSVAATGTFMVTAVVVTAVLRIVSGGAL